MPKPKPKRKVDPKHIAASKRKKLLKTIKAGYVRGGK